jgi:uncharacterized membrane protein
MLARQVVYYLSSGYFGDRVSLFAQACLNLNLPTLILLFYVSYHRAHHCAQVFSVEMGSHKLFP